MRARSAVLWGRWRSVLVFRRRHAGRTWVRLRTFNKHRTKRCGYPSPRFFVVPLDCAEDLGQAIIAAARCEPRDPPGWWHDFIKQYQAGEWRTKAKAESEGTWSDEVRTSGLSTATSGPP